MFESADLIDFSAGSQAYYRYNYLMQQLSALYEVPVHRVTAAFVALSPNSDYHGNLRSLVSVLKAVRESADPSNVVVSTYKHCRDRAWQYATGEEVFMDHAKGLKTRAFYLNIMNPETSLEVTVDGHIKAVWEGANLTMRQAKVSKVEYTNISKAVVELAFEYGLMPHQVQAVVWLARKRALGIRYDAQLDLFYGATDPWKMSVPVEDILPY